MFMVLLSIFNVSRLFTTMVKLFFFVTDALGIGNNQVDMPFFRTEEGRYLASCKLYKTSLELFLMFY